MYMNSLQPAASNAQEKASCDTYYFIGMMPALTVTAQRRFYDKSRSKAIPRSRWIFFSVVLFVM
jgi:hypothetical protein